MTGKRDTGLWRYSKRQIYTSWTMKWCLVMLILAGVTRADNSVDADYSILKCPDLNSQEEIDLNEVSPPSLSLFFPLSLSLPIFAPFFFFPRLRNRGFLRSTRSIDASNRENTVIGTNRSTFSEIFQGGGFDAPSLFFDFYSRLPSRRISDRFFPGERNVEKSRALFSFLFFISAKR